MRRLLGGERGTSLALCDQVSAVWGHPIPTAAARPRQANASAAMVHRSAYVIRAEPFSITRSPTRSRWNLRATTYRSKRDFPVERRIRPDWDIDEAIGGTNAGRGRLVGSGTPLPAYLVTVEVDIRTLAVASSKA